MAKGRILFVNQEIFPYIESPLADFCRQFPQSIQEKGREIRNFMPRFGCINERKNQLHEVIRLSGMNLIINNLDRQLIIKVASIQSARMQVYFIDNEDFFQRKYLLRDKNGDFFEDNDERAIFFAKGTLETVTKLGWQPHLVHCNGWISCMLPFYIKRVYKDNPLFTNAKVIVSLFDEDFSEPLSPILEKKLRLDGATPKDLRNHKEPNYINSMKAAIDYSAGVVLASPNVNPELIEYAKENKKPIVEYIADPMALTEAINAFYDTFLVNID